MALCGFPRLVKINKAYKTFYDSFAELAQNIGRGSVLIFLTDLLRSYLIIPIINVGYIQNTEFSYTNRVENSKHDFAKLKLNPKKNMVEA